jgi:outer membrane protein OmpA-like peptidoglycan-associated protein
MSILNFNGLLRTVADDFREQWAQFNPLAIWVSALVGLGGIFSSVNWGSLFELWAGKRSIPLIQGVDLPSQIDFRYIVYAFIFSVVAGVLLRPLFGRVITLMVGQNLSLLSFVYVLLALRGLFIYRVWVQALYFAFVLMFISAVAIESAGGLAEMISADHDFGGGSKVIAVLLELLFLLFCLVPLMFPLRPVVSAPPPPPAPSLPVPRLQLPNPKFSFSKEQVHFASDSAALRPEEVANLGKLADRLVLHPAVRIYVDGYCDQQAGDPYNFGLSHKRADAVAAVLESHGVAKTRLVIRWFGRTNFVAPNETETGRASNRRVELSEVPNPAKERTTVLN